MARVPKLAAAFVKSYAVWCADGPAHWQLLPRVSEMEFPVETCPPAPLADEMLRLLTEGRYEAKVWHDAGGWVVSVFDNHAQERHAFEMTDFSLPEALARACIEAAT